MTPGPATANIGQALAAMPRAEREAEIRALIETQRALPLADAAEDAARFEALRLLASHADLRDAVGKETIDAVAKQASAAALRLRRLDPAKEDFLTRRAAETAAELSGSDGAGPPPLERATAREARRAERVRQRMNFLDYESRSAPPSRLRKLLDLVLFARASLDRSQPEVQRIRALRRVEAAAPRLLVDRIAVAVAEDRLSPREVRQDALSVLSLSAEGAATARRLALDGDEPLGVRTYAVRKLVQLRDEATLAALILDAAQPLPLRREALMGWMPQGEERDALVKALARAHGVSVAADPRATLRSVLARGVALKFNPQLVSDRRAAEGFAMAAGLGEPVFSEKDEADRPRTLYAGFHPAAKTATRYHLSMRFILPQLPFKFLGAARKSKRIDLGLEPGRQVLVLGMLDEKDHGEQRAFMALYRELWGAEKDRSKRPFPVFGADIYTQVDRGLLDGLKTLTRDDANDPLEPLAGHDALILYSKGELLDFYAAGTLSIVGRDRNVMEPAGQGKAGLYLRNEGAWTYNGEVRDLLSERGALGILDAASLREFLSDPAKRARAEAAARATLPELRRRADEASVKLAAELLPSALLLL